jgi:outer membrane receptor protein involved in Fe transport
VLLQQGYFGQLDVDFRRATFYAGARYHTAGSGRRFFSPSAGVASSFGRLRVRGSLYRSFRVPTLDEMFRQFRVGNILTYPNPLLRPETMFGGEAGFDWTALQTQLSVTFYRNALDDLVTNVTVSSAGGAIIREKRNAGTATAAGAEVEVRRRWRDLTGEISYLFVSSLFDNGARVPQVARQQGSAQLTYSRGGTLFSAGLRACSAQFEDDLNQFLLPGFAVLHVVVERRLAEKLSVTAAVENVLNRVYVTGFTPTPGIGAPRLWRLGLRWRG